MKNDIIKLITDILGNVDIKDDNNILTIDYKDIDIQLNINYLDNTYIQYETNLLDNGKKCRYKLQSNYRYLNDLKYNLEFFKRHKLGIWE